MKNADSDPLKAIQNLQSENSSLKKELGELSKLKAQVLKEELRKEVENISGISFLAKEVELNAQRNEKISFEIGFTIKNAYFSLRIYCYR